MGDRGRARAGGGAAGGHPGEELPWPVLAGGRGAGGGVGVASLVAQRGDGDPVGGADPPQGRGRLHPRHRPHASGVAVQRRAPTVRPSLGGSVAVGAVAAAGREVGVRLCRVGLVSVWSSIEDVTWCSAAPAPARPAGWPGGSWTPRARCWSPPPAPTSTNCAGRCGRAGSGVRVQRGRPGRAGSTITFDPLTGCADPVTATERATDMLAATSRAQGGGGGSGVLGRPGPPGAGRAAARRRAGRAVDAGRAGLGGRPGAGRPRGARAAAPGGGAGVRAGRHAVRADQRPDPHLDHVDDHARARLAHPPGRCCRGRADRRGW